MLTVLQRHKMLSTLNSLHRQYNTIVIGHSGFIVLVCLQQYSLQINQCAPFTVFSCTFTVLELKSTKHMIQLRVSFFFKAKYRPCFFRILGIVLNQSEVLYTTAHIHNQSSRLVHVWVLEVIAIISPSTRFSKGCAAPSCHLDSSSHRCF